MGYSLGYRYDLLTWQIEHPSESPDFKRFEKTILMANKNSPGLFWPITQNHASRIQKAAICGKGIVPYLPQSPSIEDVAVSTGALL